MHCGYVHGSYLISCNLFVPVQLSFRGSLGVKVNLKNKGFYPPINTHFAPFDQLFEGGLHCLVGDICACCFAFSSILNSSLRLWTLIPCTTYVVLQQGV